MMYLRLFKRFVQIGFDVTINELEIVEFFCRNLIMSTIINLNGKYLKVLLMFILIRGEMQ